MAAEGAAVLIRAVEPLEGIELMRKLRATSRPSELTRGPGRLAQALGIDRSLDGTDLTVRGPLWLADRALPEAGIRASVRIGITRNSDRPWRFYLAGSPWVSGTGSLRQ